jgi:hypothetical protein
VAVTTFGVLSGVALAQPARPAAPPHPAAAPWPCSHRDWTSSRPPPSRPAAPRTTRSRSPTPARPPTPASGSVSFASQDPRRRPHPHHAGQQLPGLRARPGGLKHQRHSADPGPDHHRDRRRGRSGSQAECRGRRRSRVTRAAITTSTAAAAASAHRPARYATGNPAADVAAWRARPTAAAPAGNWSR